jgi:arginase
MCPSALRYADLADRLRQIGYQVTDMGNVDIPIRETLIETGQEDIMPAMIKACEAIYDTSKKAIEEGCLPIFLGGDHSISIGTVGGVTHHGACGVIWIDAHGDFNDPRSSGSGNIHGMPLATLVGMGAPELVHIGRPGAKLKPEDVVMIGIRELDLQERDMLRQSNIKVYTMRDIDEQGMSAVINKTMDRLAHLDNIHVSLDVDSLDPQIAPGVGTPVPGGLTYREAHLMMETIADSEKLSSMDIVEINPMLDRHNETAQIAIELTASLLGKYIL